MAAWHKEQNPCAQFLDNSTIVHKQNTIQLYINIQVCASLITSRAQNRKTSPVMTETPGLCLAAVVEHVVAVPVVDSAVVVEVPSVV